MVNDAFETVARSARKHPWHLWGAFLFLVLLVLAQNILILTQQGSPTGNAIDDTTTYGEVSACVNTPPTLDLSGCPLVAFVNTSYLCTLSATDNIQNTFVFEATALTGPVAGQALFAVNDTTIEFVPQEAHIGNYTVLFSVDDGSFCSNAITTALQTIQVLPNNFTPYLLAPIPNQTWEYNTLLIAFDLDDYFADPNNDPLVYSASGNANVGITILAGEVTLNPGSSWCGLETVFFTATDPTNRSATSNPVLLNVTCPPPSDDDDQGDNNNRNSGGGGGGGGSRAVAENTCISSYTCYAWSACQYVSDARVSPNDPSKILIEGVRGALTYKPTSGAPSSPNEYLAGYQWRSCIDTRRCPKNTALAEAQTCDYAPNCFDGIKNQDETAVDCGGVCGPCSTCEDGIQNGLEEDVDCGGPFCNACNSCTNGKLDGLETGRDCGGPDCPACATCADGIKNGQETGVDCGGPFCTACVEEQTPAARFPWLTWLLIGFVVLATLFVVAVILKRQIASAIMALLLRHQRTNRMILLPADVKADILRRLTELNERLDKQPILKSQEALARIIRDYFKVALGIPFEFTNEELIEGLERGKLNELLQQILRKFFARINVLEFSGVAVGVLVMRALIAETRELVLQTAVLTVDDLRAREGDLQLREIDPQAPSLDRGYLLLSQLHLAIEFNKPELAQALYQVLQGWYEQAPLREQQAIYEDVARVFDELRLSLGIKKP